MEWWKCHSIDVIEKHVKPSSTDYSLNNGLLAINQFIAKINEFNPNKSYVFSRGNNFDCAMIESAYSSCELNLPYKYYNVRDVRTAIDILYGTDDGHYTVKSGEAGFINFDCLHNAAMDAYRLNELYQDNLTN